MVSAACRTTFPEEEGTESQDHRAIAQAGLAAARRVPNILRYNAPSALRTLPAQVFADISDVLVLKLRALACYGSQARHDLVRLAQAEATFWGGRAGVLAAEAFYPVRWHL